MEIGKIDISTVLFPALDRGNWQNEDFHGADLRFGPWELSKRVFPWNDSSIEAVGIVKTSISMERFPDQDRGNWQNEDFHGAIPRFGPWKLAK